MQNVLNELTDLTSNLLFMSETDAEWETFALNSASPVLEQLCAKAGMPIDSEAVQPDFADFLTNAATEQDWMSDEEKNNVARYQALQTYIAATLTNVEVYRLGEVEVHIFVVGTAADGSLLALATHAVET